MSRKRPDQRNMPAYGITEAARYVGLQPWTLRSWTQGRMYPIQKGERYFKPLIQLPDKSLPNLSFINLVEAFVMGSIRRKYGIPVPKVRKALDYVHNHIGVLHALADARFLTDGADLFVERYGKLVSASESGQIAMRELLNAYLKRIEHDQEGQAIRLFPLIRGERPDQPRTIVIDPFVSFGRPCVTGTGVPTSAIAERYKGGDSVDELAEDYGFDRYNVEEAIRCELDLAA